ncbi:MAG TPA: aminotransferase class V-fold PLP-dependent enzyme [Oligoflexia bacterium]|nr:aminotransferase class V-fold PLP-dependent enzyme [Oligoflexia bacterium]HMP26441.1 aminotransferase class V-fold PLP-dependent enzyme [Oligoflexia bacterium]
MRQGLDQTSNKTKTNTTDCRLPPRPEANYRIRLYDNTGCCREEIIKTIKKLNKEIQSAGGAGGYGTDSVTGKACSLLRNLTHQDAKIAFVATGTNGNHIVCRCAKQGKGIQDRVKIIVPPNSHLFKMEKDAPAELIGIDFLKVQARNGKIDISQLNRLTQEDLKDVSMLHIAQPTEYGTVYTTKEMKQISEFCKKNDLLFGVDGARLPYAAFQLKRDLREITTDVGVDIFTLGISKIGGDNGCAVILLTEKTWANGEKLDQNALYKYASQHAGTRSKTWLLSGQFQTLFENNHWQEIVRKPIKHARKFAAELVENGIKILYPVQTNGVFVELERSLQEKLRKDYGIDFCSWPFNEGKTNIARFMFPHNATKEMRQETTRAIIKIVTSEKKRIGAYGIF